MIRVRITYKKGESLKYVGHLDLHRVWERTIRRSQLPLAYSQGFHPQPRIQQACPLPLGFTSDCEIIDLWLKDDLTIKDIQNSLIPALQPGIEIAKMEVVPLSEPPLQTIVVASDYLIQLLNKVERDKLNEKIDVLLSEKSIIRERRGKSYDLRLLILEMKFNQIEKSIFVRLSMLPGATGRPEEVLDVLGINLNHVRINRTNLVFSS
jgi:radical SAM-linked protein